MDDEAIVEAYNRALDKEKAVLSREFKQFLKSIPIGPFSPPANQLFRSALSTGYLIRVAEESFGSPPSIDDEEIQAVLNDPSLTHYERLEKATTVLDMRSQLIHLEGVDACLFIVPTIPRPFRRVVEHVFQSFDEAAKKAGHVRKIRRAQAEEIAFRNAVWGYLFRAVEMAPPGNK